MQGIMESKDTNYLSPFIHLPWLKMPQPRRLRPVIDLDSQGLTR
jgi:hypothetical protein